MIEFQFVPTLEKYTCIHYTHLYSFHTPSSKEFIVLMMTVALRKAYK